MLIEAGDIELLMLTRDDGISCACVHPHRGPPWTTIGPYEQGYCRVPGEGCCVMSEVPQKS